MSKLDSAVLILSGIGVTGILASSVRNNFLSSILDPTTNRRSMFLNERESVPSPLLSFVPAVRSPSRQISSAPSTAKKADIKTGMDSDVNRGVMSSWAFSLY